MTTNELATSDDQTLTRAEFLELADVPHENVWFNNLTNPNTKDAYMRDVKDFMRFTGIVSPEQFRAVVRRHVIKWRDWLAEERKLAPKTIQRKLSALSSLYEFLCNENAVALNPVDGVARPGEAGYEGFTAAIGNHHARDLLEAPPEDTVKGRRDRAILAVLLYHALRRDELCKLKVKDVTNRRGVPHLRVTGKGQKKKKIRFVVLNAHGQRLITEYLDAAEHGDDLEGPLFRPVKNNASKKNRGDLRKPLDGTAIYKIVKYYGQKVGVTDDVPGFTTHSLRATAATNALENKSDIAQVQQWMGHANVSTTRLYDKRQSRPEDSPSLAVRYE